MRGSIHVSGTYRWLKKGVPGGSRFLTGGAGFPCQGVGSTLPPPASCPQTVPLNDLRIVPSGLNEPQFRQRHLAGAENRENNSDRVGELP